MQTIEIGTKIDLQDLLASRMLIQANSGGGKSGVARVLIEETAGIVPFIMLDVEGEYYTLKEKLGDILIIGGHYADVAINLKSAKLLPKEIIGNQLSVIIDLSELQMHDRIMYAKYFLEAMMDLPKEYWLPYLVFIEEAHKLCGQQDKHESGPAIKDLMTRGRKRGYCGILITQRISKLHKDAAAECNNKFIGRTFLDIDMDRSAAELGMNSKKDALLLRDMKPREFYCFGTSIEPHHVHSVIIKEAKTKFPKSGSIVEIKPQKPTGKLLAALMKLNELPQEAAKELKNIQELQAEVKKLKAELANTTNSKVSSQPAVNANQLYKIEKQNRDLQIRNGQLNEQLNESRRVASEWHRIALRRGESLKKIYKEASLLGDEKVPDPLKKIPASVHISPKTRTNNSEHVHIQTKSVHVEPNADNPIKSRCAREIIKFLAGYPDRSFTKAQVAIASGDGYAVGSGNFNNALSELRTRNLILLAEGSRLQVNNAAMEEIENQVGEIIPQEFNAETFKERLNKCEKEVYEVLLRNPVDIFSKSSLAEQTETRYASESGNFNNALSRLNVLEIIVRDRGNIKLNPELL